MVCVGFVGRWGLRLRLRLKDQVLELGFKGKVCFQSIATQMYGNAASQGHFCMPVLDTEKARQDTRQVGEWLYRELFLFW